METEHKWESDCEGQDIPEILRWQFAATRLTPWRPGRPHLMPSPSSLKNATFHLELPYHLSALLFLSPL